MVSEYALPGAQIDNNGFNNTYSQAFSNVGAPTLPLVIDSDNLNVYLGASFGFQGSHNYILSTTTSQVMTFAKNCSASSNTCSNV